MVFKIKYEHYRKNDEFKIWRIIFVIAAIWNLIGGILGMMFTELTFSTLFDKELTDPLITSIYRGAWGTTFVYFIGYLLVAFNPQKHTGVVITGTIGKFFFALNLLSYYLNGLATNFLLVVVIGDFIFTLLLVAYLVKMFKRQELF